MTEDGILSRQREAGSSRPTEGPKDQKENHEIMTPQSPTESQEVNYRSADEVFAEDAESEYENLRKFNGLVVREKSDRSSRSIAAVPQARSKFLGRPAVQHYRAFRAARHRWSTDPYNPAARPES